MNAEEILQVCASRLSIDVIGLCGTGAYGSVHLAYDQLGRFIVLKIVDKTRLGAGWIREFNGLRAYCQKVRDHSNLIAIYHVEDCGDYFCYTMEAADNFYTGKRGEDYYRADTLALRLESGRTFSMEDIFSIATDLLGGLEVMHQVGLIHRDVKPANVLFVNGHAKLSDMGLVASSFDTHSVAGTPGFLPPEIMRAIGKDTHNTPTGDFYALGKVIYCLLTGLLPDDFPEIPPHLLAQPEMKRLNRMLCIACNENRERRFQTASDFRRALQECFAPRPSWMPRRRLAWGMVCCLSLGLLAAGMSFLHGRRLHAPEAQTAMPEPQAAMPEPQAAMPEPQAAMPELQTAMPEPQTAATEAGDVGLKFRGRSLLAKDWHSAADVPVMEDSGILPPTFQGNFMDMMAFLVPGYGTVMGGNVPVQALSKRLEHMVEHFCVHLQDVWLTRTLLEHGLDKEMPLRQIWLNASRANPVPSGGSRNASLLHQVIEHPVPSVSMLAFLAENGVDLNRLDERGECPLDKLLVRLDREHAYLLPGVIYLIRCGAKSRLGWESLGRIEMGWMREHVQTTLASPPPLDPTRVIRQRLPKKRSHFQSTLPPIRQAAYARSSAHGLMPSEILDGIAGQGAQSEESICLAIREAVERDGKNLNAIVARRLPIHKGATLLSRVPIRPPFTLLTYLVENGVDLHNAEVDDQPFLLWIVEKYGGESWCDELLQYLVEHGAPVNARLLGRCFDRKHYQTLYRLYLETGPHWDENQLVVADDGYWKNVPWEALLLTGSLEDIRQGVERGEALNARLPRTHVVPLQLVFRREDGVLDAYRLLENAGAEIDFRNRNVLTDVMCRMIQRRQLNVLRFLVEEKKLPVPAQAMHQAVTLACSKKGDTGLLEYLLNRTPCPVDKHFTVSQENGRMWLWDAVFYASHPTSMQQVNVTRWLLERGYLLEGRELATAWQCTIGSWRSDADFRARYEMVQILARLGSPPKWLLSSYRRELERLRAANISIEQLEEIDRKWPTEK